MSADQAIKEPCRLATAANITLSGLQTIDGVTTVAGDRVLARAQTSAVNNGIYVAAVGGWSRATDFDGAGEVVGGTQVAVTSGTDRAGSAWRVAGAGPIVIATDPIPFERAYDSESVTFLQAGTDAIERSVEDKLRDCLDVRDFDGADPTGVNSSTAAFQAAIAAAVAEGKTLRISRGEWLLDDTLLGGTYTERLNIVGDGMNATRILNRAIGKPLFNLGNTYYCSLKDLCIEGNNLTDGSGNGHAIELKDPVHNSGTLLPGQIRIERVSIIDHRGEDENYDGDAMPACAIYMSNALGAVIDQCYFRNNGFGIYAYQAMQPEIRSCTFDAQRLAALVNDQCENLKLLFADVVGDNTQDTGGTVKVGAGGDQSAGTAVRAGAVVDWFGHGSTYVGGKYKNHAYSAFSLYSLFDPLVTGAWILQDIDDCAGVYNAFGARVIANEFALGGNSMSGSRVCVLAEPQGGFADIGVVDQNTFTWGGDGDYGILIHIDGSGATYVSGALRGNKAGSGASIGTPSNLDAFVKVTGLVRKLAVTDNHLTASANLTVAIAYDYSGVSAQLDEGLIDDGNSTWDAFGGGVITTVKSLPGAYTGLQASGKLNVNALTVQGTQVVGARNTGWTAATGTAAKGAYATYAGQTVGNPPTQAQVQNADNAVKALSQRFKALEDAARAHGLIN